MVSIGGYTVVISAEYSMSQKRSPQNFLRYFHLWWTCVTENFLSVAQPYRWTTVIKCEAAKVTYSSSYNVPCTATLQLYVLFTINCHFLLLYAVLKGN